MDYGTHDDLTALLDAARAGEEYATRLFGVRLFAPLWAG